MWCGAASDANPSLSLPPKGNAAWVYDMKSGETGMWADELKSYNSEAKSGAQINTVFSYGGDMEWYSPAGQVYFDQSAQSAAQKYQADGNKPYIVAVVDGRMDGTQSYSPDLSKRTEAEVLAWADDTAALYCSFPIVSGLQVDLEPVKDPYTTHLILFIKQLSSNLRSRERNCVSAAHPNGRSISVFGFAEAATTEMWTALGPNGYFMMSGYDLSSAPAGTPSPVDAYFTAYAAAIQKMVSSAEAAKGKFMIGIPASASAHEFETYTTEKGVVTKGAESQLLYTQAAVEKSQSLCSNPQFLGLALWGFTSAASYPPHTHNLFTPGHPFANDDVRTYLAKNLGCGAQAAHDLQV